MLNQLIIQLKTCKIHHKSSIRDLSANLINDDSYEATVLMLTTHNLYFEEFWNSYKCGAKMKSRSYSMANFRKIFNKFTQVNSDQVLSRYMLFEGTRHFRIVEGLCKIVIWSPDGCQPECFRDKYQGRLRPRFKDIAERKMKRQNIDPGKWQRIAKLRLN